MSSDPGTEAKLRDASSARGIGTPHRAMAATGHIEDRRAQLGVPRRLVGRPFRLAGATTKAESRALQRSAPANQHKTNKKKQPSSCRNRLNKKNADERKRGALTECPSQSVCAGGVACLAVRSSVHRLPGQAACAENTAHSPNASNRTPPHPPHLPHRPLPSGRQRQECLPHAHGGVCSGRTALRLR